MDAFFATFAVLLFVSLLVGTSVCMYLRKSNDKIATVNHTENLSIQTVHATILSELQNVKELATVRRNFTSIAVFNEDSKKILGSLKMPGTKRQLKINYNGTVVCGCDLDEIKISRELYNGNHLKIVIPNSRILDIYPNIDSFQVYDKNVGIFAEDIKLEEQNNVVATDLNIVKRRLIDEGILRRSNKNVEEILSRITKKIGLRAEIIFSDGNYLNSTQDLIRLQ